MKKGKVRKTTKKGFNRNLLYSIVLVTLILSAVLVTYYLFFSPRPENWTATIIDQIAIEDLFNPEFNTSITSLLKASGFDVKYYPGEDITVEFYKNLPSKGGKIIILRAHSAVRKDNTSVDLFTSEPFIGGKYSEYGNQVSHAQFLVDPYQEYFAIGPTFVQNPINPSLKGTFADSLIILMGCYGLNKTTMAQALISRGAKVVVGWTGWVELNDTDSSTIQLLKYLLVQRDSIDAAVSKINRPHYLFNATMDYYPKGARNYVVPTKKNEVSFTLSGEPFYISSLSTLTKWKRSE